jgi:hypothetical protein
MYLKSKGIPAEMILRLTKEAGTSALRYQEDKYQLDLWQNRWDIMNRKTRMSYADRSTALKKIERKIAYYGNEIAMNPSTAMIDSGLLPNIVDDVDTASIQDPYKHGIDAFLDKSLGKLGRAEGAARTLFMTEDTSGYKTLNNAVKMTDYTGRYVLYHHYKSKGMKHEDAVSKVMDEFINFDLPTHRTIEYLNSVGIIWFSKYQLRVLKQIKNIVKEHPFSSIATLLLGTFIGNNNIINSIPFLTKDVTQTFGNPLETVWDSAPQILNVELADFATGG